MIYVFDTSAFASLFKNYYRKRFPTLWKNFDSMIDEGRIISTREVRREIKERDDELEAWAGQHSQIFHTPTAEVARFVTQIYAVKHFQANIEQKKLLKGGLNADPWVIATTSVYSGEASLVTLEVYKENAAKIPNICQHFKTPCLNLETFMEAEDWSF